VDEAGFFFEVGTGDCGGALASGEDFAAGEVEGRIFEVAAGEVEEAGFGEGEDDAADACPIDGAGAHGAGFGAGVEGAEGEFGRGEALACLGAGEEFGVLGWVAGWRDGVVAGGDDDLAVFVDDEGAEGVCAMGARGAGEFDGLAEEDQVLLGSGFGFVGHCGFILQPLWFDFPGSLNLDSG